MTDFLTPPPFDPDKALTQLRRDLRDTTVLRERSPGLFEIRGVAVLSLQRQGECIAARLARAPSRAPRWDEHRLGNPLAVRHFKDALKQHLKPWVDADD